MINVSEKAHTELYKILNRYPEYKLRILITSGGCSGFYYDFQLVNNVNSDDIYLNNSIIIDDDSYNVLGDNISLDYYESFMSKKFTLNIHDSKTKCSCEKSFSPF